MTKGLFITGTGTDVGKTFATGVLVKKVLPTSDLCYRCTGKNVAGSRCELRLL